MPVVDEGLNVQRTGQWLPQDYSVLHGWVDRLIKQVDNKSDDLDPILKDFEALVEDDEALYMLSQKMFEEVPMKPPYLQDPTRQKPQVRDFKHMLELINHIIKRAPEWNDVEDKVGLIGCPINAILDWPMGTASGGAFLLRTDVNEQWAKILDKWANHLKTKESANVLNRSPKGWFSKTGVDALVAKGNVGQTHYTFEELYICDPNAPYHGFGSWDSFFTRRFRDGIRPLAAPENGSFDPTIPDPTAVIVNACESTPFLLAKNVQARAAFWLKGQPYSMLDILANSELAPQFIGGTVYQAYLSPLSYHRWHSPVSGTIVKKCIVPGTYYSENHFKGFANPDETPDPTAPNTSQAYIAEVATRGLIFIQADNQDIGLMCIIVIGMCEVSTCEITVDEGEHVMKGDEIGTFHFGGSSHCLVFRKESDVVFKPFRTDADHNTPVLSAIAAVESSSLVNLKKMEITIRIEK